MGKEKENGEKTVKKGGEEKKMDKYKKRLDILLK